MNAAKPKLYQCAECGLHYEHKINATQCAVWCKQHKSCNLAITKLSVERATRNSIGISGA